MQCASILKSIAIYVAKDALFTIEQYIRSLLDVLV
jgi:hypothetical protein